MLLEGESHGWLASPRKEWTVPANESNGVRLNMIVTVVTGFLVGTLFGIVLGFGFAATLSIDAVLQLFTTIMNAMPRIFCRLL